MIQYSMLTD